jgi:hypothetical protein
MSNEQQLKIIRRARSWALATLFVLGILILIFSLISGSEAYGGSLAGVVKNSPNSIPWVIFLILVIIAWKSNVWGGFLLVIFGGVITYYFNFTGSNFFMTTFIFCLMVIFLGLVVLFTGATISKYNKENKLG